jgi:hypothetical protein
MNNVDKPALYGLTQPTIGTFFLGNHLIYYYVFEDKPSGK